MHFPRIGTHKGRNFDNWRVEVHWIHRPTIFLADGIHQVDDGQHCDENSQCEFRLVEKSFRDLLVSAVLDVVDLEDGEQPQ